MTKIDLDALPPAVRSRVERALRVRDTTLNLKFNSATIEDWKLEADTLGVSLTQWIEATLNAALPAAVKPKQTL
jgi:predicted HicB family RNase H-like nuclease